MGEPDTQPTGSDSDSVDLSIVVNIFREARLIHPTLRSLAAAANKVIAGGWSVEVVLVLDRTDVATFDYLDEYLDTMFGDVPVHQLSVNNGDLGLSRNSGLNYSRGRFVAFSDDDNLYSDNWLSECLARLTESGADEIMHPEYIVNFDQKNILWRSVDSDDPLFDVRSMAEHNNWDAVCVGPRRAFEAIPYTPSLAGPGFGPEDWHWNCQTLDAGWAHRSAPETVMFYRVKSTGSLLNLLEGNRALLAPTKLLSVMPEAREVLIDPSHGPGNDESSVPDEDTSMSGTGDGDDITSGTDDEKSADSIPGGEVNPLVVEEAVPSLLSKPTDGLRRFLLRSTRVILRTMARGLRWVTRIHPRLAIFASRLRPAVEELLSPLQRVAPLPLTPSLPPVEEEQVEVEVDIQVEEAASEFDSLPPWLLEAWRSAHSLEPAVFPSKSTLESIVLWAPKPTAYTDVYWQLVEQIGIEGHGPDYLLLVPWVATGGAHTVVLNYLRAIRANDAEARITILLTSPGRASEAPDDDPLIRYVSVPAEFHDLHPSMQDRLVGTLLIQLAPARIHLINSPVGFRVFELYGKLLAVQSRLYVSMFTLDETPDGQRSHYLLDAVRAYFDQLSGIFVDNQPLVDLLADTYALPRSKFFLHYQPVSAAVSEGAARGVERTRIERLAITGNADAGTDAEEAAGPAPLSVLWAARLDRQKRPDLLAAISRRSQELELNIQFFASGAAVLDQDPSVLENLENSGVTFLGPYDTSISSLHQDFDVLLLTSQWEGLPLTLLDGALNELTIVAPDVGGVSDFVRNDVSGFLISQFDDVETYVTTLKVLSLDPAALLATRSGALDLVHDRHSWNAFTTQVRDSAGYLG